ncbi:Rha family transcriptional regulator [Escherichia coli]|uniref:Rha family transcriptional regulator n=1 Tax=Escherichia coli TaxID=562 RepID=UPI0020234F16|nr:Rha family transcriptional regulator [Escherichia coli]
MNNHSVIPAFDFREMVQAKNGEVVTTSRKIAKYFGKRHGDVLRKIEQVKADCSREFSQRNFASADYIDEQGKVRPMYSLTKDGWIMVVMGFTGKAAAAIKESYIAAFNWMAEQLSRRMAIGEEMQHRYAISKRLVRTVLIFTESSDQLSRATDRVPGLPASPGYVQ